VRGKGKQLALIAIDYLQLVEVETQRRGGNREEAVAQISKTCKRLAKDLGLPVLAMSQLNREIEKSNREPQMSDIRESGAIEQDASIILCPWRGEIATDPERKNEDCDADIIILKNRGGRTGKAPVRWHAKTMEFRHDWSRSRTGRPPDFGGGEHSLIDDYQPHASPPSWHERD
jgi:replicative DNA helicase